VAARRPPARAPAIDPGAAPSVPSFLKGKHHRLGPCYPAFLARGGMSLRRREFIAGFGGAVAWPLAFILIQRDENG
jgi:hypothetical protein